MPCAYVHILGCALQDFHLNQLEFEIPSSSVRLSEVFGRLEAEKSMLHIQEYSVSQPTLEQVRVASDAWSKARCRCLASQSKHKQIRD